MPDQDVLSEPPKILEDQSAKIPEEGSNARQQLLLLPHVEPEKLSALKHRLEQLSAPSLEFYVLLSGATLIATLGLFQNSSAVIIGAMIIAPLMRPLIGLSFGSLSADTLLLRRSSYTLVTGTLLGVTISYALALLLQSIELTPEILSRTRPTLLDLGVACFAGALGAYCQLNERLSETIAGVAIAVALVPPLSVVGIGLASDSLPVWTGAGLLYLTNLIGITVAGALVFLVRGYTPLHRAKRGLLVSTVLLSVLVIPLGLSMRELVLENQLSRQIKNILKERTFTFKNANLQRVEVRRFKAPMEVVATVYGSERDFTPNQVNSVQDFLVKQTGIELEFRLRIIPLKEMTAVELTPTSTIPLRIAPNPSAVDATEVKAPESFVPDTPAPEEDPDIENSAPEKQPEASEAKEPPEAKNTGDQSGEIFESL